MGGRHALGRFAGPVSLIVSGFLLANCAGNVAGRVNPRYGVASSARAVQAGQPVPKGGGVYRVGKPYTVAGRTYTPAENNQYSEIGMASWYGDDFHGRFTANGEVFDQNAISAAHPTLPLPSYARVTNLENHRSIMVRVNDRGPYVADRLIDVSVQTAKLLGFYGQGVARVKVEYVGRAPLKGSDDRKLASTLRNNSDNGVQIAAAESFAPADVDSRARSVTAPRRAPVPPGRPYGADETSASQQVAVEEVSVPPVRGRQARAARTVEFAAAKRPQETAPPIGPVSAYAPVRYDGHAGFMSGRGLY
jgi:peptidoglycan lytic transglycosylase